jgi:hypothetical protein
MQLVLCFLIFSVVAHTSVIDPAPKFYDDIIDICNPTQQELITLQNKLLYIERPIIEKMTGIGFISKEFRFISDNPAKLPEFGSIFLNSSANDRENCIVLYASYNERYPQGVRRLLERISASDFQGHVYYRIGGWPNIEGGDLRLIHVPFAFKVCFLKEMQAKHYKRVLYLDASLLPSPQMSLNTIFNQLESIGFLIQAGDHPIGKYMNEDTAAAFGMTLEQSLSIQSCSAAFVGIDFTNLQAVALLDAWHQAAYHPFAFFSDRADQNALSILIHQMGLQKELISRKLLGSIEDPSGIFIMDRNYVKDERIHKK